MNVRTIAKGLGWFSVALGIAELAAPRQLTRALGIGEHDKLVRSFGARELGPGIALLAANKPAPYLWARVAGDALDLAALAGALRRSSKKVMVGVALAAVAGIGVVDAVSARRATA
ncbi:MAG TPA: hypothetical protein VJ901_15095 [Thermoanaerobaculia bacterium]|nr:hypothetical protein [Thermoanaerobaculia bacterium]